jgi:hypothetical protein
MGRGTHTPIPQFVMPLRTHMAKPEATSLGRSVAKIGMLIGSLIEVETETGLGTSRSGSVLDKSLCGAFSKKDPTWNSGYTILNSWPNSGDTLLNYFAAERIQHGVPRKGQIVDG